LAVLCSILSCFRTIIFSLLCFLLHLPFILCSSIPYSFTFFHLSFTIATILFIYRSSIFSFSCALLFTFSFFGSVFLVHLGACFQHAHHSPCHSNHLKSAAFASLRLARSRLRPFCPRRPAPCFGCVRSLPVCTTYAHARIIPPNGPAHCCRCYPVGHVARCPQHSLHSPSLFTISTQTLSLSQPLACLTSASPPPSLLAPPKLNCRQTDRHPIIVSSL
jgi:hypothetical protein